MAKLTMDEAAKITGDKYPNVLLQALLRDERIRDKVGWRMKPRPRRVIDEALLIHWNNNLRRKSGRQPKKEATMDAEAE